MQGKNIVGDIVKENKSKILIAFANILFLGALVYIFALMMKSDYVETERADFEIRRDIMDFTAYIFRNEEIIYADSGIGVSYLIENGDKIGKNQAVARLNQNIRGDSAELVKAQIESLEKKIDILRKSNINLEYTPASIEKVNKDSNDLYVETLKNIKYNKMKDAGRNRDEILILLNKKQLITGGIENFNGLLGSLSERQKELEFEAAVSNAADNGAEVFSAKSGIFYKKPDGYENYFTGEAVRNLDMAKFNELMKIERDADILNKAVGKVAYDYNWFFVCRTNLKEFADGNISFTENESYNIICPYSSNKVIAVKLISSIREPNSDDILFVFETFAAPADFDFLRKQTVQIVSREVRGIKVPDSAVVVRELRRRWEPDDDGNMQEIIEIIEKPELTGGEAVLGEMVKGVYVLQGSEVRFKRLDDRDRIAEFDGYALYAEAAQRSEESNTALQAYEDIITAGKNLFHGKIVNQ